MVSYIVRIEMVGARASDYDRLQALMIGAGFQRRIHSDDGKPWALPSGTFVGRSARLDLEGARDKIVMLAKEIHKDPFVLVSLGPAAWRTFPLGGAAGITRRGSTSA